MPNEDVYYMDACNGVPVVDQEVFDAAVAMCKA